MGRLLDSDVVKKALYDAVDDISRGYMTIYGIEEDDIEGIIDNVPSVQPTHTNTPNTLKSLDCVDRQAAISALINHEPTSTLAIINVIDKDVARWIIKDLPSVQPDIIHCKDCKYWREGIGFSYCDKLYGMGVLNMYDYMKTEDEYCSMAERRTDD